MPGKNYYQVLGISKNSTDKEIKQAYRRLARKYHPDVNPGDKSAEAKFKEINEAYEVLSDPEKRKKYDRLGDQWQYAEQFARASGQQGGERQWRGFGGGTTYTTFEGDLGDLFENLFRDFSTRGTQSRTARRHVQAEDIDYPVEVTLEEAYQGTKRIIQLQTEELCQNCRGTGAIGNRKCANCGGLGRVSRLKRLEVKIPQGVKDGSRIRVAGEGREGYDGSRGDLYLVIKVLPHKRFERKGDDLYVDVPVPLVTAVLGGEVEVPTLKGKLALKIPAETQNGKVFRLSEQGMPRLGDSSHGDLLAKVTVILPTKLKDEERKLFERLQALRPH